MHRELTATFGASWYDNPACSFDKGTLDRISSTKDQLRREGHTDDPPHLIAALSFGFWVALLGKGGAARGTGWRNYEMSLWRPCLFRAFPNARLRRKDAHRPLDFLRTFRNRIAHHEPIFTRDLAADYRSILMVTAWISADVRAWIDHHSRVVEILACSRDDGTVRF